ncbi:(2Fe-2S) ferredoxin domain-containing protein [Tenuifilum thalassicum]|nr:(2Fe-2S) ferredoxin domain-containing protein [Tenuifilum thalassicum]
MKVEVIICSGTLCYLMGGAELQLLSEHLPPALKDKVIVKGSPCVGFCDKPESGKPPFALINGRKIQQASVDKLISEIKQELGI